MTIDHIAIWAENLEKLKDFYIKFFDCKCGEKYTNPKKNFTSYFLTFKGRTRIELMHNPEIKNKPKIFNGYSHLAIRLNSKREIDILTEKLKKNGLTIISGPRTTGDGYYETSFLDPEGNLIEITKKIKSQKNGK
ncbi:MAG: VOC family protein [Brevinematales bacterium]|nr:VOC family protein [Brevinematales bacterium]